MNNLLIFASVFGGPLWIANVKFVMRRYACVNLVDLEKYRQLYNSLPQKYWILP
ncbi:hypothetical protein RhiirA5_176064 [Rhizophagus irregularis]|uniref:Uncharacterized protein n=1 Tax=Rhizophagus irregularis TaxID=588596 RepID=A0A2N0PNF8_9GLOM|nr:hypothetical protein RhiirA5_176064 [Rhizophagus irregularis]